MNAAFIGNDSIIEMFSKPFQSAITDSDKLKICGVMSTDVQCTTKLAIALNTKAYLSVDALLKDADIIFVCRHDNHLAAFSTLMKEKRVRGKIFCHFSPRYDSSILNFSSTNSYFSVGFPYMGTGSQKVKELMITFEGDGKRYDEFEQTMLSIFPKAIFCTKNDKRLSSIAARIITDYLKFVIGVSMKFFKASGQYDETCFMDFVNTSVKSFTTGSSTRKIRKKTENDIRKDMHLLAVINHPDTREFYRNMETHIADTGIYTPDERETILRTLKKRFR